MKKQYFVHFVTTQTVFVQRFLKPLNNNFILFYNFRLQNATNQQPSHFQ